MSQIKKKLRPLWVDEDRISKEANTVNTPGTLVRRQEHQQRPSVVHHACLPLREGVVRLTLVVKTRFQDWDKPSQLIFNKFFFRKTNSRLS